MTATAIRPLVRPDGPASDIVPKIPLDALDWREIGAATGDHPRSRLIAKMQIGPAEILARFALEQGCEALVMGAYGHSRLRETLLGGTTRAMLTEVPLPLLMAHRA